MFNNMSRRLVLLLVLVGLFLSSCSFGGPGDVAQASASGDLSLTGQPTITVAFINQVLADHGSPAQGLGQVFYDEGLSHNIDPAFALAFYKHESNYGLKGEARSSLSIGNLRCLTNYPCQDNFAWFPSWTEGIKAWYRLISGPLYVGSGLTTVSAVLGRYAPPTDSNDDTAYVQDIVQTVQTWRSGQASIERSGDGNND
jgi:Mannosyl-glycoprotein endo-beta-N-acetylglucosaminidase